MASSLPRLAIVGAGSMGGAILSGLIKRGVPLEGISVTTATEHSAKALTSTGLDAQSLENNPQANIWAVQDAEIIVLGVKPHYILGVLEEIAPVAQKSAVIISVAAGVTLAQMEAIWPGALVRAMPNTPSEIGKGVTGVSFGREVRDVEKAWVLDVFHAVGEVVVVPESSINALSAFSGSGPAFVYFFLERFLEVARSHGFSDEEAHLMVAGTVTGAMELLASSGKTPGQLRQAVTSPGGSTQAALEVFEAADLTSIIRQATDSAIARAAELSGQ
jgi:pyrroline-5-carboxylate reductase